MKKLNLKHKYLIRLALAVLVSTAYFLVSESDGLFRIASADQSFSSPTNLFSEGLDSLAISPDGNSLANIDINGQITIQDIGSGLVRTKFPSQSDNPVRRVVFGPDSKSLVSISENSIRLLDTTSGDTRLAMSSSTFVTNPVFSPDGRILAFVNQNDRITLWNTKSGSATQISTGHQDGVKTIVFSPNSRLMATNGQSDSLIKIWDMSTGKGRLSLTRDTSSPVTEFIFSPDNKTLAIANQTDRITLWNSQIDETTQILTDHQSGVNAIAFNPDGTVLATGSQNSEVKLWAMESGLLQSNLPTTNSAPITHLAFSPDGKSLAGVGESKSIYLWDIPKHQIQSLTGHRDWVIKAVFSSNNKTLASMDKTGQIIVWNIKTGIERVAFQAPLVNAGVNLTDPILGNTSTNLAASSVAGVTLPNSNDLPVQKTTVRQINQNSKKQKKSNHDWKGVTALTISPDGKFYSGTNKEGYAWLSDINGKNIFSFSRHHGASVTGVVFSTDGKRLVTVGRDTELQTWDAANGKMRKSLLAHEHPIRAVAASPDGKFFASAGEETRIMLWDAQAEKLIRIFSGGHTDFVNAVNFSTDGKYLASAGADGLVLIWDVEKGRLLRTLSGHSGEVNAVSFSKNNNLLASGSTDSTVILWDAATGRQLQSFSGHQSAVRTITFSPNGQRLVSTGEDSRILVWDMTSRKLEKQISGATNAINAIAFDPLGNMVAGSEDGGVTEWDIEKGQKKRNINVPIQPQSNNSEEDSVVAPIITTNLSAGINQIAQASSSAFAKIDPADVFIKVLDWLIPSAEAALPDPNQGPGGPILVVTSTSDPFGKYYAEILRTEGLNIFTVADITTVNATTLAAYDVVILAKMALSAAQVSMLSDWVTAGGNLIAMRPASQLASLLGVTPLGSTLSNGYLLVDTSQAPGNGIVNQTIQFHGDADRYSISGASNIATLYTNATTATANPAVTLRSVGTNGGQAAAFTYDLASSIVYTRQGNPAWATQERDGFTPIRSDDKFYGDASGDPQLDWVDLNKIAIPQADEQQRLLANLILQMNSDKKPLPRFWYFPKNKKAVVIMTGDDHGNNGTQGRFDQFIANSPPGCSVANWECIRGTSYIFPNTPLSNAQAASYNAQGFEVGLHINTSCADFTPASLRDFYTQQIGDFTTKYTSIPAPITQRHHCIAWSDWVTGAIVQLENGIRFDTSYYFWPPSWVQNRPGFFSGSGMPMRFANLNGSMIDVYHAASEMTDESGQTYPFTINTLLDRALGSDGFYGAFVINAHTDLATIPESDAVIASAPARGIPIVSSKQMMDWLDGRNSSSFDSLNWSGNTLSFNVTAGSGANNLRGMLPASSAAGVLLGITYTPLGGSPAPVSFTIDSIKGISYGFFPALPGAYSASFGSDTTPPTVTANSPGTGATDVPLNPAITATFSKSMDAATINSSTFELRDTANTLIPANVSYDAGTSTATLTPSSSLSATSTYTATVKGGSTDPRVKDLAGNALAANVSWSFTTQAQPCSTSTCSSWSNSTVPGTPSVNDPGSVELGVKFRTDIDGFVTGIRFYKGSTNTGTHTGTLWTSNGTQLATATFTNETASGWQQVNFSAPVAITAGTTYVASYHAPNGNYAATNTPEFSAQGVDNPPIHLLRDGVSGGNGVYTYSTTSSFPNSSFNATNYWVDLVFTTNVGPDTTPPTVTAQSPVDGATGVAANSTVTATFSEAMDAATISTSTVELRGPAPGNVLVPSTVSFNASTRTVTLTPSAVLSASTLYTATIKGGIVDPRVKDVSGNALAANFSWTFTTAATGSTGCSGSTTSIWPSNPIPSIISDSDTSSVELGVKFRSNVNGSVCGIRFYKGSSNTGVHVGTLWTGSGQQLAQATFTNETASGWQQVLFNSPVSITANTVYVASYHAPVGRYSANGNYFTAGVTNGPLYAFSDSESGGNGVYLYGSVGLPINSFQSSNYWVDVLFTTDTGPDTTPPTISSTTPATGATGVNPANPVTVVFSEPMQAATIEGTPSSPSQGFELRNALNNLVPATVTYNTSNNTATLSPSNTLATNTPYTAKVIGGTNGVKDAAGNPLAADLSWGFTTGVDPCSTGGNPIVCENSKTGNPSSEWDITGAGDLSIQGYATDISVNRGQTARFKIDTPSTNYRLDIYRLGYYSGNGARKVATVEPTATLPQTQPNCLSHTATGLIDCGNWSESASWTIPSDAVSGIYFAKVIREDGTNTGSSHIVFIVRDDASTSDLLFQTSDTTWQAYNNYGGNSLYTGLPAGRAYKVSYNRPFNTRNVDNGQDWLFNSEYPTVRWLEANGYNVSYFTGIDAARFGNLIQNHKVFLSVGHDEYWSKQQRQNVEAARDKINNPVNLAFLSGNEVFWKVRWENNITNANGNLGADAYRTLVCYKETHAGAKIDPSSEWTGTWRDPRFSPPADGGLPENSLTGTIFMVNDGATTAIDVPAADGKMRFWRNTSAANLAANSTLTLPNGTLGYEWDEELDNGFRPAGLIDLSTTLVANAPILQDYGSSYSSGTAIHSLTLYRAASRALVFGAGTVQWAWGLDNIHDRSGTPANDSMKQATVNLFADMGVQPATLQSGLTAAIASNDSTAPTSTITSPVNNSSVVLGSNVVISGTATDAGGGVIGGVEVSVDGGLTWHPANGRSNWTYSWTAPNVSATVNIKARAVDDSLNLETAGAGINVNVGSGSDATPPTVSMTAPANGATISGTTVTVSATANDNVGVTSVQFLLDGAPLGAPDTVSPYSIVWNSTGSANGAHTLSARASDAANNTATATNISVTVSNLDTTPPTVSMTAPANGVTVSGTTVTVSATANDNVGVTSVQFLLDGAPLGAPNTLSPYSIVWNSTGAADGLHTLSARASDAANNTATATNISVTVSNPVAPIAPTSLTGTAISSTQINLTWVDNSSNETGFRVERCQNAGCSNFALLTTVGSNISSFSNTGLTANTSYSYRVQAFNATGSSLFSNTVTVVTRKVTGLLNPTSNSAVLLNGDSNGYETNPANANTNNSVFAVDTNSGTNTNTSCTDIGKDKHLYFNYGVSLPVGSIINGIEVRLDARADATAGNPSICVQLSSDGGLTWTTAKTTPTLTTAEATYTLGGAADTWGRSWTVTNFSNTNFRVRVINVSSNNARDFSLDWIAVQVTYQ